MRLRSILVAIVAIVYLVQPVRADNEEWPEHVRTPRAETLRAAVAEWCDEHIGYFILNKGHPVCLLRSEVRKWFFFGEWRMVERRYWWSRRKDETTGRRVAILWLVEPNGYPPIEPDNEGRETVPPEALLAIECSFARVAVDNPARVPVVLVGPAASQCGIDASEVERWLQTLK